MKNGTFFTSGDSYVCNHLLSVYVYINLSVIVPTIVISQVYGKILRSARRRLCGQFLALLGFLFPQRDMRGKPFPFLDFHKPSVCTRLVMTCVFAGAHFRGNASLPPKRTRPLYAEFIGIRNPMPATALLCARAHAACIYNH